MFEIIPIQQKSEQETLCALANLKYDADLLAYKFIDEKKPAAVCQFRITPEGGEICGIGSIGEERFENLFLLVRGVFNFIDICGGRYAVLKSGVTDDLTARALGFSPDTDGKYGIDLKGFFENPCKHK